MKPCDDNIRRLLEMTQKMISLAEIGDEEREDTGCGVLYAVLRDAAFKLKHLAEQEKSAHIKKGWWTEE